MRDLFLIIAFVFILYASFKRPFIGISMWMWVAMHFPGGWVYGFASSIRYNMIIVVAGVCSYLFSSNKATYPANSIVLFVFLFLIWTLISSIFTISYPEFVWPNWIEFLKISLLFFFAVAVMKSELHVNVLLWALAFSIGFYGALEGLKFLSSGGGHKIAGLPGHRLTDRNELALAFNMMLPLLVYLGQTVSSKYIKFGLKCVIGLSVIAIVGTYSRGGLIALIVVGGYFWLQSSRKVLYAILVFSVIAIGSNFMPSEWSDRMDTIETATEDNSFLGRILGWKQAVLIANDNILTGGGFDAGQVSLIWQKYQAYSHFNNVVDTSNLGHITFKAAHSIYFQVLGDHGYVGFFLYFAALLIALRRCKTMTKRFQAVEYDGPLLELTKLMRVSLVAFCAGGAGVSIAYFDMFYGLLAIVVVIESRLLPKIEAEYKQSQRDLASRKEVDLV